LILPSRRRVFPDTVSTAKNTVIALLVLTTVGGAVLSWKQYRELMELKASALSADDRAGLQKKIWDLQKTNRELSDKLAAQGRRGTAKDNTTREPELAVAEGEDMGPPGGRGARFQQFAAMRDLMQKPEVQAMLRTAEKGLIDSRYAALFRNLNLTPEQSDKLTSLLMERQTALQDVFAAAREQGLNPRTDPDGFRKLVTDAESSINDSIKSLLGDTGYNQFANYEQTMPQRNLVTALQARLANTDSPLNTAQAEQLVQILAATSPTPAEPNASPGLGQRGDFGGGFGRIGALMGGLGGSGAGAVVGPNAAVITPAAVAQAGGVLNPTQLSTLQQLEVQQQNAQQLQQLIRNAQQQNNPGNTGTTNTGGRRRGGG
jgi:hypothetical protein